MSPATRGATGAGGRPDFVEDVVYGADGVVVVTDASGGTRRYMNVSIIRAELRSMPCSPGCQTCRRCSEKVQLPVPDAIGRDNGRIRRGAEIPRCERHRTGSPALFLRQALVPHRLSTAATCDIVQRPGDQLLPIVAAVSETVNDDRRLARGTPTR